MEKLLKGARTHDFKRLQFDMTEDRLILFDKMVVDCGLRTRKDLFDYAMTLLKWAIEEAKAGNQVASFDRKTTSVELLKVPILDHVRALAQEAEAPERQSRPPRAGKISATSRKPSLIAVGK